MKGHKLANKLGTRGQMTIELCVVFPVAIAIAVITVNAITFFGHCSEFDRVARNAVRVEAASPERGQDKSTVANRIKSEICASIKDSNISCEVEVSSHANGLETYKATLKYWPSLFGMGLKSSVFGVQMPPLSHVSSLTVDPYIPGEIF